MTLKTMSLVGLLAVAASAAAQHDNIEQYGRPEMTPQNQVDMSLARFTFCAERAAQGTADKVLETPLASEEEAKLVRKLASVNRECSPTYPLPFTATAVRNALATMAYRRAHRGDAPPATPAGTPPPSFSVAPAGAKGTAQQEAAWFLGAVANCVVFVDPPGVHKLVTGPIDVPEEDKRFTALAPALGRCTPPHAPALTTRVLRGYLANALLQRVGRKAG